MKYVLIIMLFLAVALYVYWRLRPYLKTAGKVLGVLRDVRRMSVGARQQGQTPVGTGRAAGRASSNAATEKLVRCSSCGTWLPASRAITLRGSNEAYCSQECVERSTADEPRAKTFGR